MVHNIWNSNLESVWIILNRSFVSSEEKLFVTVLFVHNLLPALGHPPLNILKMTWCASSLRCRQMMKKKKKTLNRYDESRRLQQAQQQ